MAIREVTCTVHVLRSTNILRGTFHLFLQLACHSPIYAVQHSGVKLPNCLLYDRDIIHVIHTHHRMPFDVGGLIVNHNSPRASHALTLRTLLLLLSRRVLPMGHSTLVKTLDQRQPFILAAYASVCCCLRHSPCCSSRAPLLLLRRCLYSSRHHHCLHSFLILLNRYSLCIYLRDLRG